MSGVSLASVVMWRLGCMEVCRAGRHGNREVSIAGGALLARRPGSMEIGSSGGALQACRRGGREVWRLHARVGMWRHGALQLRRRAEGM